MCAEILAIMIKQNKYIKCIFINNIEHKISQYADETSLILEGSPQSLFAALEAIFFLLPIWIIITNSKLESGWVNSYSNL